MNLKAKFLAGLACCILFLSFTGCSEEVYHSVTHSEHSKHKDAISFKEFKQRTGIKDFSLVKSFSQAGENLRDAKDDYFIDTLTVMFYASPTGKDTYTFKIFPLTEDLNPKEYYNLVYEKNGNLWNEIIFKNKEKENPGAGEPKLEFSEMLYNRAHQSLSMAQFCEVITITNANCYCADRNQCDWCDGCIRITVTYEYCPSSGGGGGDGGSGIGIGGPGLGDGGGGGPATGIYIPNPYNGEEDLNNAEFVFAMSVASFLNTLPPDLKAVKNSRYWMHAKIVDWMRNNDGLTLQNKAAVTFALNHFKTFTQNFNTPNWSFTSMERFEYWVFNYVLNNPNTEGANLTNELKALIMATPNGEENLLEFVTASINADKIYNDMDDDFLLSMDQYMDMDVAAYYDPTNMLATHFTIQCAVLRANHPNWSDLKIYWEASKEMVHLTLDVLGLVPVFGEVADLTNGVLYTIEGDGVNASLSYASAIPIVGWATAGTKLGLKVINVANDVNSKVKLVWKVTGNTITFGNRNQLRKVIGLAVGDPRQAHHIIPWGKQGHEVVQEASKSGSAFHMNEALNGIPLSTAVHNGSHANYDIRVQNRLQAIRNQYGPNMTPDQAYDGIMDLINDIRTAIQNNPTTKVNDLIF